MNSNWMLPAAIAILGVVVTGCQRETKTVEKSGTTVVQPKETVKEKETVVTQPVPGPAGPAGPQGEKGEPGKPATPSTSEPKKE
jgi:hypothetical protein